MPSTNLKPLQSSEHVKTKDSVSSKALPEQVTLLNTLLTSGKTKTILGMVGAFLTGNAKPGSTSIAIPGQQPAYPPPKPRLLLCAPSNAAVDEIVLRLIGGIRNAQGQHYQPNIVLEHYE